MTRVILIFHVPSGAPVPFTCMDPTDSNDDYQCGYDITTQTGTLNPQIEIQTGQTTTTSSAITRGLIHAYGINIRAESVLEKTTMVRFLPHVPVMLFPC